jgi:hypothetical protein
MDDGHETAYNDGGIVCDQKGILIRRYYPWGPKRIPYDALRGVEELPLVGADKVRRWRIWGSGDFLHWWNLDPHRPDKRVALVLDVGRRVRPTITPEDPNAVERILKEHLAA